METGISSPDAALRLPKLEWQRDRTRRPAAQIGSPYAALRLRDATRR